MSKARRLSPTHLLPPVLLAALAPALPCAAAQAEPPEGGYPFTAGRIELIAGQALSGGWLGLGVALGADSGRGPAAALTLGGAGLGAVGGLVYSHLREVTRPRAAAVNV
jgi:hypothetical protein